MNKQTLIRLPFPWLSLLLSFLLAAAYLCIYHPIVKGYYPIPAIVYHQPYQLLALVAVGLLIIVDTRRFYLRKKIYDRAFRELLQSKKQLTKKAHTYNEHSEKLKLFISDRLLEYIQYDEKFLHFKNIASEVRHNGVIGFDKVQTALSKAIKQSQQNREQYQDALESMRYLWDLLDLSTADNIALYIGNYLCECEEHYFQAVLKQETSAKTSNDSISPSKTSPYKVTFYANKVIKDYVVNLVEQDTILKACDDKEAIYYDQGDFKIHIDPNIQMLGNPNHLKLLFENLINNAQFYHKNKTVNKKLCYPIQIQLLNQDDNMLLRLYNRGQHIKEENKDKVFQLAFSTRRKKGNHGKGLGLYFANSISQGYEGKIDFTNIHNIQGKFHVDIYTSDGEKHSHYFSVLDEGTQPTIVSDELEDTKKNIEWNYNQPIQRIVLHSQENGIEASFDQLDERNDSKELSLTLPNALAINEWQINLYRKKNNTRIQFTPLDITGVMFSVSLPTAKSRLNYDDYDDLELLEEDESLFDDILAEEQRYKS